MYVFRVLCVCLHNDEMMFLSPAAFFPNLINDAHPRAFHTLPAFALFFLHHFLRRLGNAGMCKALSVTAELSVMTITSLWLL